MKHTARLFPSLVLIAVFTLSACAPALSSPTLQAIPASATLAQSDASATSAPTHSAVQPEATVTLAPTEVPALPIATSRGSELHATDPTAVNLAAGQIQLVEFFRFT
jgi:hypothetical protein